MWIPIFITAVLVAAFIRLCVVFQDKIKFMIRGQDEGFKINEILLLWKLAKRTGLEQPESLFYSLGSLNSAISKYISEAKQNGSESQPEVQNFLSKLYKYRTKIDIDHENRRGLESSKYLEKGQRLRILLKGSGVFSSEVLNNASEIAARLPLQKNTLKMPGEDWIGKNVSVYLWRKGDAGYVFDTKVTDSGVFHGQNVIYLAQSSKMERAQKRRSVRSECSIPAHLYFITSEITDFTALEVEPGYKCILEDISEDGAMVRVGGKGESNVQIKLQFEIDGKQIVMFGIVRAVEYNAKVNQSRLHFECLHIEKNMRNAILNYVYKIVPEDKKEVIEAVAMSEQDANETSDYGKNQDEKKSSEQKNQKTEQKIEAEAAIGGEKAENQENGANQNPKNGEIVNEISDENKNEIDTDELAAIDVEDSGYGEKI